MKASCDGIAAARRGGAMSVPAVLLAFCAAGCAVSSSSDADMDDGERPGQGQGNNPITGANNPPPNVPIIMGCAGVCEDFPAAPIFDTEGPTPPPANAPQLFGDPDDFESPGPCVIEPQLSDGDAPGALFPRNWLQPRFRFEPSSGETLWEIRLSAPMQKNELVAYTTRTTWPMPRDIWRALAGHSSDAPVTVTIRGVAAGGGRVSGTRGTFVIAPVEARGKMVYWATTSSEVQPGTSKLVGFDVGDESVIDALTVPQAGDRKILGSGGRDLRGMYDDGKGVPPGHVQCIGCHVSTPDGSAVAFTDHWPWNAVLASVEEATVGGLPDYVTPGAEKLLNQPWLGMQTFSQAHWSAGDRIVVVAYSPRNMGQSGVGFSDGAPYPSHGDRLAWIDLETNATFSATPEMGDVQQQLNQQLSAQLGSAFGLIALDGETRSAAAPSFSHDGTRIAYTSAEVTQDGRLGPGREADLHVVPFNDRAGGAVEPIAGASEPGVAEYYPAFSADDRLIAFTRVQAPDGGPLYYRPDGEVYVVPSEGGTAVRLIANDPPACGGERSPGVINSWPKWSPAVMRVSPGQAEFGPGVRTYYWLIFSSARAYPGSFQLPRTQYSPQDTRSSQLYMTAVVRDEDGELSTYPAVYLWNQDPSTSNLTPAWDEFKIPPVPGPD
jgi:hypothetical protein